MVNESFWRGRKVLLTGHTGFKGGWLSLWLHQMGAHLSGFSLPPPTSPSLFEVARVGEAVDTQLGDIRDAAALALSVQKAEPEVVFHLAAQPLVRLSYQDPVGTYATNVMGSIHLLEAVRKCPSVRAVVMVTSDKCYENREWEWGYRENEAMGGYDPYSNSKGCTELLVSAYRSSFFNPAQYDKHRVAVATGRAGNVIGGGDWADDRLIPDMLRAFGQGVPAMIRNPSAIRPWQHVLEPLSGYLMLAQQLCNEGPRRAGGWNFGPADEDARPVRWIADELVAKWGGDAAWHTDEQPHPHEAHHLKLDISKARSQLGWRPIWTLAKSLDRIVSWQQAWRGGQDMQAVCLNQIADYDCAREASA